MYAKIMPLLTVAVYMTADMTVDDDQQYRRR